MNKALLFKEWIKTRWVLFLLLTVFMLAMGYIALRLNSAVRNVGIAHLWEVFIIKNVVLLNQLKYFPLLAGITIGLAQYIPEIVKKRLKLTLHLPLSENRILFVMLGYGLSTLFILFLISYLLFLSGLSFHFPEEIVWAWIGTVLPQILGGFAAYLLTAWIVLEPTWERRLENTVIGLLLLSLFLIEESSWAYLYLFPFLTGSLVILFFLPRISIGRFKTGLQ